MKLFLAIILVLSLTATASALEVKTAQPACCLKVQQPVAQPELRVVTSNGWETKQGIVLQGSYIKLQGE